jgi:hypothetical protein
VTNHKRRPQTAGAHRPDQAPGAIGGEVKCRERRLARRADDVAAHVAARRRRSQAESPRNQPAWKLDRLGRNLRHLVNVVHDLNARGIGLRVLTGQGAAIDTTTAAGKLVFGIFAALAEFERELIRERTIAGLAAARARGRNGGRKPKMTPAKARMGHDSRSARRLLALDLYGAHSRRRPVLPASCLPSDALVWAPARS